MQNKFNLKAAQPAFLPMSKAEMQALGWKELDVLLVSGDAYVDHPAFGPALLGRWLLAHGFKVGIVAQPNWTENAQHELEVMGRPRLFAGITAGSMDSMLCHYTAFRKKRSEDAYTPGGKAGARPNRASIVYTSLVRQTFPGLPVVLGGIEASLRRITHYDFWSDAIRRSILLDSKADLLVYGMGEQTLLNLAEAAQALISKNANQYNGAALVNACKNIPGIVFVGQQEDLPDKLKTLILPSHEAIRQDPKHLLSATLDLEIQVHQGVRTAAQSIGERLLIINPPAKPLLQTQMDQLYSLPFARRAHPAYSQPIPAEEMLRTSITTHRGCGGGCSFCSLSLHQGRLISSRSRKSILEEAHKLVETFGGKGAAKKNGLSISDVGGPTANMWQAYCEFTPEVCTRASCLYPTICPGFRVNQEIHVSMLRDVKNTPGVGQVRVASGIRYDLHMRDPKAFAAYVTEFTGGQLKVAPEHTSDSVLAYMRKPLLGLFEIFLNNFISQTKKSGKEQYVVPYLISAFPGCTDGDMRALGGWLANKGWKPQQVQCFIPTPGTVATAMYCSRLDADGNLIYVARSDAERLRQHHILLGNDSVGIADWNKQKRAGSNAQKTSNFKQNKENNRHQQEYFKKSYTSSHSPTNGKHRNENEGNKHNR